MTVREIVALAAEHLGRSELADEANGSGESPSGELRALLRCYNLVENEIALDYCRLVRTERLRVPGDGKLPYSQFSAAPVEVLCIADANGRAVEGVRETDCIELPAGEVFVTYSYSPDEKELGDDSAFSGRISARLMSFGVACEMCLAEGRYREATAWEGRYRGALRAAEAVRRNLRMRSRRWV